MSTPGNQLLTKMTVSFLSIIYQPAQRKKFIEKLSFQFHRWQINSTMRNRNRVSISSCRRRRQMGETKTDLHFSWMRVRYRSFAWYYLPIVFCYDDISVLLCLLITQTFTLGKFNLLWSLVTNNTQTCFLPSRKRAKDINSNSVCFSLFNFSSWCFLFFCR